jgi:hypothetical protein
MVGNYGALRIWEVAGSGEPRALSVFTFHARKVAYNRDGTRLTTAGEDGFVRLWDAATGQEVRSFAGHTGRVYTVTSSLDGSRLASGGGDGTVRLWDAVRGEKLQVLPGHTGYVSCVAFSPDGRWLASGDRAGAVRLWYAAGRGEARVLKGHTGRVGCVVFSPDGSRLASGGRDGTVRVWDVASGGELLVFKGHMGDVPCLAYSPDGWRLASGGEDGTIRIIDARPWNPERQAEEEARGLVEGLCSQPLLRAEALEHLRDHPAITEEFRRRALQLTEHYPDDPQRFAQAARKVVRYPDATQALYGAALRWAQTACRLAPDRGAYLTTLGLAQYRLARYADALETLTAATKLNRGDQPADLAFLALVHHRLGHRGEAKAALGRLREGVQKPLVSRDEEALAFAAEAETLLQAEP